MADNVRQWIRKATLLIGVGNDVLDVSTLQFTFQTQDSNISTLGTLQLRLWNPSPNTVKLIFDAGENISLSAGYDGNYGQIFTGAIIQKRAGNENGVDSYLDLSCVDGDFLSNFTSISSTFQAGLTKTQQLKQIGRSAGFKFNRINIDDDGSKSIRGTVYYGLVRDQLRRLTNSLGAEWSIKDGEVNVIGRGAYLDDEAVVLNSATGMIGKPVQTFEGLEITCLLNPNILPSTKIQIDNRSVQGYQADLSIAGQSSNALIPKLDSDGIYKTLFINHTGDTRGREWYTNMILYAPNVGITPAQVPLISVAAANRKLY